ncbi:hypothetical protein JAAARDRAFT_50752 [Jaapia argillacea MUCL 33604]|uniref:Uncharacterized protein n=1 Tax=Jaapia argillacea MUCL 33604 TaxID=933084 RepID=A0A067PLH5_9AGAM|nr:hypothetical protein JAAARDRAFT_50752 [Jaapia argillacea MUCL 33604]
MATIDDPALNLPPLPYRFDADPPELLSQPFLLSELERLELSTNIDMRSFLDNIILSKLSTIRLVNLGDKRGIKDSFLALIARSSCVLKSLTFIFVIEVIDILARLEKTPCLIYFRCWNSMTDDLFVRLTVDDGSPVDNIVPKLTDFAIGGGLSDMVRSRWKVNTPSTGVSRLERVFIHIENYIPSEPFLGREDCVEEGLVLWLGDELDPVQANPSSTLDVAS